MADADFEKFDAYEASRRAPGAAYEASRRAPGAAEAPRREPLVAPGVAQRVARLSGAVISVGLIAGLGLWAYNLAVRDVHGVPVIRALQGPARVAPDDPGGTLALHQGLAVNEIAADGTAAAPAETLTLAPRQQDLAAEDAAMGPLAASTEESAPAVTEPPADPATDPAAPPGAIAAPSDEALAARDPARPAEPLPDGPPEPVLPPGADPALAEGISADLTGTISAGAISPDIPGVATSPVPALRPGSSRPVGGVGGDDGVDAMAEAAAAAVAAAMAPPPVDIAANTLPSGTRLAQIGVFPTEAEARLGWERTAARFGALLDGKRRVIEPASSGGSSFFRLRVSGFSDLDDARRFCAALKAENAECVAAVVR